MTVEEVVAYYKSGYNLRKVTGMSASNLGKWVKYGYVPEWTQLRIEKMTNGALKATFEGKINDQA